MYAKMYWSENNNGPRGQPDYYCEFKYNMLKYQDASIKTRKEKTPTGQAADY